MAAEIEAFGWMRNAAGHKRKPDAGASAGDEILMRQSQDASHVAPIERLGERDETSGAKYALKPVRGKVRRTSRKVQGIHALVRVGSAAMPAPFAFVADKRRPFHAVLSAPISRFALANPRKSPLSQLPCIITSPRFRVRSCPIRTFPAMKRVTDLLCLTPSIYPPRHVDGNAHKRPKGSQRLEAHLSGSGGSRPARHGAAGSVIGRFGGCRC